jgi:type IV secretion system protein VirB4
MATATHHATFKKEIPTKDFIPYGNHVTKNVIKLVDGNYLAIFKCQGAAHESADASDLNQWHNMLNNFMKNLASPHTALWTHVIRREVDAYPGGEYKNAFCRDYNEKYRQHMQSIRMLVNEMYVSVVYRPHPSKILKWLDFSKKTPEVLAESQAEEIEFMEDCIDKALNGLARYEPKALGLYEHNGITFSEAQEFLSYLIDGEWRRQPLLKSDIRESLATTRPFFGKGGLLTFKGPSGVQFGAAVAIDNHTDKTYPGILNGLLGLPFEFVLSQSFTFISKTVALARLSRQQNRMVNAGDVAQSQIDELTQAMDDVQSNRYSMGTHHLSLIVRDGNKDLLNEHIGLVGTVFSDAGMKWVREDISLAGCFWAQLPGNFKYRNREGEITSLNFAAFACMHNYPSGRIDGAQWGHAVTMFSTTSGSPYYFNFHKVNPDLEAKFDPNHKELAHTIIIGQSGVGKTVLENHFLAQLQKFMEDEREEGTCVLFDKDEGASIAVKQMGGRYFAVKNGLPTGWQPLQLPPTQRNLLFVQNLVKMLVHNPNKALEPKEAAQIEHAVESVMGNPARGIKGMRPEAQRLSAVAELLQRNLDNGIFARLLPWCEGGQKAWLFDNEVDTLDMQGVPIVGFDVTDFLDNAETRAPTIMYLLHRINDLLDGRRVPIFLDEFWKLIGDDIFAPIIEDMLVTIRKKNGFLVMLTQMPEQVTKNAISHAIIQQSATKIFLPNPSADRKTYVNDFKCTNAEFDLIVEFGELSRKFLVKQGGNSVVCTLNLKGFDDELAVLSANARTAALVERIIEQHGDRPETWLPIFHSMRHGS